MERNSRGAGANLRRMPRMFYRTKTNDHTEPLMTETVSVTAVEQAVADFKDPETGRSALQLEQIRDIQVTGDQLTLTLALTWDSSLVTLLG